MNKYEAAYNMLMILSIVDGEFNRNEGVIILDYLREMHQPFVGSKNENKTFSELSTEQLLNHFEDTSFSFFKKHPEHERLEIFESAAKHFYEHSLQSDRERFIDFAKKIIIADHKVTPRENTFINKLFYMWGLK